MLRTQPWSPAPNLHAATKESTDEYRGNLLASATRWNTRWPRCVAGARRLPVVDDCGALTGLVSLDDGVAQLARQLNDIAGSIRVEGQVERKVQTWKRAMCATNAVNRTGAEAAAA